MKLQARTRTSVAWSLWLATFGCIVVSILVSFAQRGVPRGPVPGLQRDGATLLPNGWRIAPVGYHLQAGDLPLNMVPSPDGRFLIITNNGWAKPTLTVFDTKTLQVTSRVTALSRPRIHVSAGSSVASSIGIGGAPLGSFATSSRVAFQSLLAKRLKPTTPQLTRTPRSWSRRIFSKKVARGVHSG